MKGNRGTDWYTNVVNGLEIMQDNDDNKSVGVGKGTKSRMSAHAASTEIRQANPNGQRCTQLSQA